MARVCPALGHDGSRAVVAHVVTSLAFSGRRRTTAPTLVFARPELGGVKKRSKFHSRPQDARGELISDVRFVIPIQLAPRGPAPRIGQLTALPIGLIPGSSVLSKLLKAESQVRGLQCLAGRDAERVKQTNLFIDFNLEQIAASVIAGIAAGSLIHVTSNRQCHRDRELSL